MLYNLLLFFYCRPDLVDLTSIETQDNISNLTKAFDLFEKHFNVPRLLEPEGSCNIP